MTKQIASEDALSAHTIGISDHDAQSAHDVKSRSVAPEKPISRRIRRAEERYQQREAEKKAADARKQKKLSKSEMIALARQRQKLPPLQKESPVEPEETKVPEEQVAPEAPVAAETPVADHPTSTVE